MVETPRLQAKHICHSEAKPKNLHGLTETLRSAQGDSLGGGFERVGFQPTCIEPLGLKPRVVQSKNSRCYSQKSLFAPLQYLLELFSLLFQNLLLGFNFLLR